MAQTVNRQAVVYNLGINRSGPLSQTIFLRRLLDRGVRPDLVVLEVTPLVFDYSELPVLPADHLERADLALLQPHTDNPHLRSEWRQAFCVPVYGNRLSMLNYLAQFLVPFDDRLILWPDIDDHGWQRKEVPTAEQRRETDERVRAIMQPRLARFAATDASLRAFADLLAFIRGRHVPVVLVLMPEGALLRSFYPAEEYAKLRARLSALAQAYDMPLIDARDWLSEEQFTDSYHPNCVGARTLTERLGREIVLPRLRRD